MARSLPRGLHYKHGAYFLVRNNRWVRLSDSYVDALAKYYQAVAPRSVLTFGDLIDMYIRDVWPSRAVSSQRNELYALKPIRRCFGHMRIDAIKRSHIYKYMSLRPRVAANREKSLITSILDLGVRVGLVEENVGRGIRRNKEKPRLHLVSTDDFRAFHDIAPVQVQCLMDLSYMLGTRLSDTLSLTYHCVQEHGLAVHISKTDRPVVFAYTQDLRDLIERCRQLPSKVRSIYMLHTTTGQKYSRAGMQSIWQRHQRRAIAKEIITARFSIHDLRTLSAVSHEDGSHLAHLSGTTLARHYLVERRLIPITKRLSKKED